MSRPRPAERQNEKTLLFFTVWHPRHHPRFLMFCTRGTFRTDSDKKKLVENSLFAIFFLSVFFFLIFSMRFFFLVLWSFADSIRKWCRANPAGWKHDVISGERSARHFGMRPVMCSVRSSHRKIVSLLCRVPCFHRSADAVVPQVFHSLLTAPLLGSNTRGSSTPGLP